MDSALKNVCYMHLPVNTQAQPYWLMLTMEWEKKRRATNKLYSNHSL